VVLFCAFSCCLLFYQPTALAKKMKWCNSYICIYVYMYICICICMYIYIHSYIEIIFVGIVFLLFMADSLYEKFSPIPMWGAKTVLLFQATPAPIHRQLKLAGPPVTCRETTAIPKRPFYPSQIHMSFKARH
jgi:hypothetical protein